MDIAVKHGFKLIELDFWQVGNQILLSHEKPKRGAQELSDIIDWLNHHPGVLIITDFKTDNVRGLTALVSRADRSRFIPQIYNPSEYGPIVRLGMHKPILTVYRVTEPWRDFANSADLWAVTMPINRRNWAKGIHKPILLHTVNAPMPFPVSGYYTDCLVPAT
jgi:hypothetical protein